MCPACLTNWVLIAAGAGSAGGLATSVAWKLRRSGGVAMSERAGSKLAHPVVSREEWLRARVELLER